MSKIDRGHGTCWKQKLMIEKYQEQVLKIVHEMVHHPELENVDMDYIYRWIIGNMEYRLLDEGPEIILESLEE